MLRRALEKIRSVLWSEKPKVHESIGASGTKLYSGKIYDEYNTARWSTTEKRAETCDKMDRGDGPTHGALQAIVLPILSAEWHIKPASDDPKDLEIAANIEWQLFGGMSQSWPEFLEQAIPAQYGFSVFEKVWDPEPRDWTYAPADGSAPVVRRGMTVLKKLAYRAQKTIDGWRFDPVTKGLAGLWQRGYWISGETSNYDRKFIPVKDLLIFTEGKRGDNYEGVSIFRHMDRHWVARDLLYRVEAIGIERNATGTPVGKYPTNATAAQRDELQDIVRQLRVHEEAGVTLPIGWELDILEGKFQGALVQAAIRHQTWCLFISILAPFLTLGSDGGGGSFALSKDGSDFFVLSEKHRTRLFAATCDQYLIPQMVDWNYTTDRYPTIEAPTFESEDTAIWAQTLKTLVDASLASADDAVRAEVAKIMHLPEPTPLADLPKPVVVAPPGTPAPPEGTPPQGAPPEPEPAPEEEPAKKHEHRHSEPRPATPRETALGLTEDRAREMSAGMDRVEADGAQKVTAVLDRMKDALAEQLDAGADSAELAVPAKLHSALVKVLRGVIEDAIPVGQKAAQGELDTTVAADLPEEWAGTVAEARATKMESDLLYLVRLRAAQGSLRG